MCFSGLQRVTVLLQCVEVRCSALQCDAACRFFPWLQYEKDISVSLQCVAMSCSVMSVSFPPVAAV